MTGWTDKDISHSPVTEAAVTASVTSSCDAFCIVFFDQRLHTIACDIANGRDPILNKPIDDVLPERALIREWVSGTPYSEEGNE